MPYYQIPLQELFTTLDGVGVSFRKGYPCVPQRIDNVGCFVYYDRNKIKPEDITPELIRNHLIGCQRTHCLVEADYPQQAIEKFYAEWDGTNVGGEKPDQKALYVDTSEPILEFPRCDKLHVSARGEFICGEPSKVRGETCGENGMCLLQGFDAPEDGCPISDFFAVYNEEHDEEPALTRGGPIKVFMPKKAVAVTS